MAFSNSIREYLDPVIKADQCAQHVDDIGIAANYPQQLLRNLKSVLSWIQKTAMKLIKCRFGVYQVDILDPTLTPEGVAPQKFKKRKILEKVKFPRSKKALQRYIGFLNYYRSYIPRLTETLNPFFKLLKTSYATKDKITINPELMNEFRNLNSTFDTCQIALRQPLPYKQLVLPTDASSQSAGYAVLIEHDLNQKVISTRRTYAPVAYGSKTFIPSQIQTSINAKDV